MIINISGDKDEIIRIGNYRHDLARNKGWNPLNQMTDIKTARRDIIGARGEFACCRALGIDPKTTALYKDIDKPDKGWDGIYKGWKCEFKDTEHPNGNLMYQPNTHSFIQDIWILAVPTKKTSGNDICLDMKIAGWIWKKDMSKLWEECFFDPSAKCIGQNQLNRFEDLLHIEPKQGNPFFNRRIND